jgi:hypothetical protein
MLAVFVRKAAHGEEQRHASNRIRIMKTTPALTL